MSRRPVAIMRVAAFAAATLLAACSNNSGPPPPPDPLGSQVAPPPPDLDQELVTAGETLYQQNCASCHRADLSGDPTWQIPNPDGSYPPPPHDSSGHTWHHSDQVLLGLIRDGSDYPQTRMPSFGRTLSDEEITAILEYLKSNWGAQERAYQWQITSQESQP